jgi:pimeloyl-ACP methyl ester carboxylesterase
VIRSLIPPDTTIGGDAARPDSRERLGRGLRARGDHDGGGLARARTPQLLAPDPPPAVAREVEATLAAMLRPAGFRNAAVALAHADTRAVLPHLAAPTLVLCGEHDGVTPPAVGTRLIAAIPDARLVTIPGAGHLAAVEQPERYNAAVREFLRGVP